MARFIDKLKRDASEHINDLRFERLHAERLERELIDRSKALERVERCVLDLEKYGPTDD